MKKLCSRCKKNLPLTAFYANRANKKYGVGSHCKPCSAIASRERRRGIQKVEEGLKAYFPPVTRGVRTSRPFSNWRSLYRPGLADVLKSDGVTVSPVAVRSVLDSLDSSDTLQEIPT